jgi:hypothetical protein
VQYPLLQKCELTTIHPDTRPVLILSDTGKFPKLHPKLISSPSSTHLQFFALPYFYSFDKKNKISIFFRKEEVFIVIFFLKESISVEIFSLYVRYLQLKVLYFFANKRHNIRRRNKKNDEILPQNLKKFAKKRKKNQKNQKMFKKFHSLNVLLY